MNDYQWADDDLPDGTEGEDLPPYAGWILLGLVALAVVVIGGALALAWD